MKEVLIKGEDSFLTKSDLVSLEGVTSLVIGEGVAHLDKDLFESLSSLEEVPIWTFLPGWAAAPEHRL